MVNPFAPGDFAEKHLLKLAEWFSGHCRAVIRAKTYHKAVCWLETSWPSKPVAKYQLAKFGHAQEAKFRVFGFQSDTAVLTFTFRFSPPLFFCFSSLIFVFFCWAFSRFYFGGNSLKESF